MGFRRTLISKVGENLPEFAKNHMSFAYNRYREKRADYQFSARNSTALTRSPEGPDHIICVVVDSLRAEALDGDTTGFLNQVIETDAIAPAPWTYPSVSSILTGLYPHEHGAIRQNDNPDNATKDEISLPPELSQNIQTLPEHLSSVGYETYGGFGFDMPFLAVGGRFGTHKLYSKGSANEILSDYLDWQRENSDSKTFAYLHLFDPHGPFKSTPPAPYWEAHNVDRSIPNIERWDYTENWDAKGSNRYQKHRERLWRAAIDYVDDQLRKFTNVLLEQDESSIVVFTGDHGEAFWEWSKFDAEHFYDSRPAYCVGHGGTPYDSIARVPLGGVNIEFEDAPSSLIDISPTILDQIGAEFSPSMSGQIHGTGIDDTRPLLIESARYGYEKKAVYAQGWKLMVSKNENQSIGYRLPEETPINLPTDIYSQLNNEFPSWPDNGKSRSISPNVQSRLEDLGYT